MKTQNIDETHLIGELPKLHDLQQLDLRIDELLGLRQELDDGSTKESELDRAQHRLTAIGHQLSELRGRQTDRRLERQSLVERRERNQHRLWQENPTQHEAEALQMDLQATAGRLDAIEIELADLEARIAPLEGQHEDEQRTVGELQGELAEVQAKFAEEVKDIDSELEALKATREVQAAEVSAELVDRYDRIRMRRGNPGVVKVVDDVCHACNTQLTSYMLRQLHFGRQVQQCENCNTILYWAGELRPALSFEEMREASDAFDLYEDEE